MAEKFVIIQNFAYNRYTPDYSGRPTQINVGPATEEFQKKFIECMRNCKPVDGNRFHCGFNVYYDDNTAFEVRPDRLHPAVGWKPSKGVNEAEKDEMVIVMRPCVLKDTDCLATCWHDCPVCIASGKCPSPFIRKYIGRIFFPDQYGKQR